MKSPFKFLDAYELKDKDVFFGRTEETEALYSMVFKTPLLLLYGLSGAGKTSLIQCGLASRFTGPNWYPFFIRRGENINASIHQVLAQAMPEDETISNSLKTNVGVLFESYLRPIYLIFDQFEELFILGGRDEQLEFARSVRDLIDSRLPCKVLLVMREEFIGQLYYLEQEIPTLYDFRLRVEQMGFKKVHEVITGSFREFNITLEDAEKNVEQIYQSVSAGKSGVQLPYLQVYLDMLWRQDDSRSQSKGHAFFTSVDIAALGTIDNVLARFLNEQERVLQATIKKRFPGIGEDVVRKILDVFVTEEGTKRPIRFTRVNNERIEFESTVLQLLPDLPPGALDYTVNRLGAARLLRERDNLLELAHDALAALINNDRTDEQRQINEARNRVQNAWLDFQHSGEYLSRRQLSSLEPFLPKLQLDNELKNFVHRSSQKAWQRDVFGKMLFIIPIFIIWLSYNWVASIYSELDQARSYVQQEQFITAISGYEILQRQKVKCLILDYTRSSVDLKSELVILKRLDQLYNQIIVENLHAADSLFFAERFALALNYYNSADTIFHEYRRINDSLARTGPFVVDSIRIVEKDFIIRQRKVSAFNSIVSNFDILQRKYEAFAEARAWPQALRNLVSMQNILPLDPLDLEKFKLSFKMLQDPRDYVYSQQTRVIRQLE